METYDSGYDREYDSLTGVYTREAFCRHAQERLTKDRNTRYEIVVSDFVNFKYFNSRFGAEAGDRLLKGTGKMLNVCNPIFLCGRYGADRFVTMLPYMEGFSIGVLENFRLPPEAYEELPAADIIVKFGVCENVDHDLPVAQSIDKAYIALHSIKHSYGKNVAVYTPILDRVVRYEVMVEQSMKGALERREFCVYYQPKEDIRTGNVCGAEALVRWDHPAQGFMDPGQFISVFENNGFIIDLDMYVWEQVCRDIAGWKAENKPVVPVSVNVSRRDFERQDLAERIIELTTRYGVEPSLFHAEITESGFATDPENAANCIAELRKAGFTIELDDFGAGFTSLSSLSDMMPDIMKFDMSLLRKDDPDSEHSVLNLAMQMAKTLKLRTTQEGVETREQCERLKALGCDCIQGYYFSKPLPKERYEVFLSEHIGKRDVGCA